jgi:hypothetical protein
MNSSGYHETKKFLKENDIQFNRKTFMLTIVWNSRGLDLIKVLGKVASSTPAIISLRCESYCPNGAQLKQRATSENCWCMRTMRARIPLSYQLNILTRIE